jgi:hypothetical protein
MSPFENQIDAADFGTVRRYLGNPRSPITDVLLVASGSLLSRVAELLTGIGDRSLVERQLELQRLVTEGQVKAAVPGTGPTEPGTFSLESLPDHTLCRVLFVPPFYLVWAERPCDFGSQCPVGYYADVRDEMAGAWAKRG